MPHFDALVVGAGPAGSVAALVLARSGARVALIDRRRFPRDKACGDLIGPRGVRLLAELGVEVPGARRLGDMIVVGPSGRRSLLPALPGVDYADHAIAVGRARFDATLYDAAVEAGAVRVQGRVSALRLDPDGPTGVVLAGGSGAGARRSDAERFVAGDVVVGADGANSQVASLAGLVDPTNALWGFALRSYLDAEVALPYIVLWEPQPWQLFPGYGWAFPAGGDGANVGLGLAFRRGDRTASRQAGEQFGRFLGHLAQLGLPLDPGSDRPVDWLGGWLKMGMVGTVPARGRVLLVGDAAGMVNPLQGEGIAQAMAAGRAAAAAIVTAGPDGAADHYRRH
ncbi:MAG: geranylgeranyl reductase family protein, partial [Actinopolymorphaceae bacterium]